jgi:hypothetical protein
MPATLPIRIASLCAWGIGLGFALPAPWVIRRLLASGNLPMLLGFRAYGGGPFERLGPRAMIALLLPFMLACAFECAAGLLLWGNHRSGAILALVMLPICAVFWWGFALPFPPLFALVRTALILLAWTSLR